MLFYFGENSQRGEMPVYDFPCYLYHHKVRSTLYKITDFFPKADSFQNAARYLKGCTPI